jgi:hypothetical protein
VSHGTPPDPISHELFKIIEPDEVHRRTNAVPFEQGQFKNVEKWENVKNGKDNDRWKDKQVIFKLRKKI